MQRARWGARCSPSSCCPGAGCQLRPGLDRRLVRAAPFRAYVAWIQPGGCGGEWPRPLLGRAAVTRPEKARVRRGPPRRLERRILRSDPRAQWGARVASSRDAPRDRGALRVLGWQCALVRRCARATRTSQAAVRDRTTRHGAPQRLRACYEIEAQKHPDLRGEATIAWEIDEAGVVTNARVSSTTLANERLEACIVRQVQSWQFPKSDAPTTIAGYPFRFVVADPP
jgi:hypothetical protein